MLLLLLPTRTFPPDDLTSLIGSRIDDDFVVLVVVVVAALGRVDEDDEESDESLVGVDFFLFVVVIS